MVRSAIMCRPTNAFKLDYVINPWMIQKRQIDIGLAQRQWDRLYHIVRSLIPVSLIKQQKNKPDQVFTTDLGVVINNTFVSGQFKNKERQKEHLNISKLYYHLIDHHDVTSFIRDRKLVFEGGDVLVFTDKERAVTRVYAGYGFRSDPAYIRLIEENFPDIEIVPIELVDPKFYHLDTCLTVLDNQTLMLYPKAFSQQTLDRLGINHSIIAVSKKDAEMFACNAVVINRHVVIHDCSSELENRLEELGFRVVKTPMSEFHLSGGSCHCLVLTIN